MDTIGLFRHYLEALSADYLDKFQTPQAATEHCLHDLSRFLRAQGAQLADFGLPQPQQQSSEFHSEIETFQHQQEELFWKYTANEGVFTNEQQTAYIQIIEALYCNSSSGSCFFLEGKAGCGKSFVAAMIVHRLWSEGSCVLVVGSTALSVTLYERGRTAHAAFGIPVTEVCYLNLFNVSFGLKFCQLIISDNL